MKKITLNDFIQNSIEAHGETYDYSNTIYINSKTKVSIICKIHGEFYQRPYDHTNGRGCVLCGEISKSINNTKNRLERKFRHIVQPIDYKNIPLGNGVFCKVDNIDFDKLKGISWALKDDLYAVNTKIGRMHRFILDCPKHLIIDHKNGDGLDNRRSNIRICTLSDNSHNISKTKSNTSSIYKGVSFNKKSKKWISYINGKYIGCFNKETDAAIAYDNIAKVKFGEFAKLNFNTPNI